MSISNIWQILGIEATTDERVIRRAYARRLKELDVDRQPAEFQKLREAYEWALAGYGSYVIDHAFDEVASAVGDVEAGTEPAASDAHPERSPAADAEPASFSHAPAQAEPAAAPPDSRRRHEFTEFQGDLQALATRVFALLDTQGEAAALELVGQSLAGPLFDHIDSAAVFEQMVLAELADRHPLPLELADLFAIHFGWKSRPLATYGGHQTEYIVRQIAEERRLEQERFQAERARANYPNGPRLRTGPQAPEERQSGAPSWAWIFVGVLCFSMLSRLFSGSCNSRSNYERALLDSYAKPGYSKTKPATRDSQTASSARPAAKKAPAAPRPSTPAADPEKAARDLERSLRQLESRSPGGPNFPDRRFP